MRRLTGLLLAIIISVTSMSFFVAAEDSSGAIMARYYFSDNNSSWSRAYSFTVSDCVIAQVAHKYWKIDQFVISRNGAVGWTRYSFRIGGLLDVGDTSTTSMPSFGSSLSQPEYTLSTSTYTPFEDFRVYIMNSGTITINDNGRTACYRSVQIVFDVKWNDNYDANSNYDPFDPSNYITCTLNSPNIILLSAEDGSGTLHSFVPAIDNCTVVHNPDTLLMSQWLLLNKIWNLQNSCFNFTYQIDPNSTLFNGTGLFQYWLKQNLNDMELPAYKAYLPHPDTHVPGQTSLLSWRSFEYQVLKLLSKKASYDVGQIEAANNQGALDAVSEAQAELPNAFDIIAGQTAGASNATVYSPNVWSAVGDLFGWWSQDNLNALNTIPANRLPEETYSYLQQNIEEMNNILYPDDGGD